MSELLDSAREVAPAQEANVAIEQMREKLEVRGRPGLSYEVVVPAAEPWKHLTEVALPKLVYFLDCRGQLIEQTPGIFVSAFVGERLYFFDAGTFVAVVGKKAGLSFESMREQWGERSGGPTAPPRQKLLGG